MATHPELPNNIEAEKATLGSIFLNREVMVPVATLLKPEDFYLERHGQIFEAMLNCYQQRIPPDSRAVSITLRRTDKLAQVGGDGYLGELSNAVPTSSHAETYAREVERCARLRRLIGAGGKIAAIGYNEPDAETAEGSAWALLTETVVSVGDRDFRPLGDGWYEHLERMMSGAAPGASTGYRDLDEITGGLHRGELTILAARPGVGKTSLALGIALNVAVAGGLVLVSELEMSHDQLQLRAVSMHTGIDLHRLRLNALGDEEDTLRHVTEGFGWLNGLPMLVDDRPGQTTQQVRTRALRVRAEQGPIALLVVDYLQLMGDVAKKNSNREQDVSAISRGLKGLARELDCPVLALSQLSRAVEGRASHVPMLSDLRESGSLEQDADNVAFIYRPELYDKETDQKGIAELHIAKQRQGPLGIVPLRFDSRTTNFSSLTYRTPDGY